MQLKMIPVDEIQPNPFQPREMFDKESISELADSIRSRGEIQPVIVRKHGRRYQIIAGERRWRAAKFAGMKKIPVLVKDTAEEDVLLESLIENLHRLDLTSTERENAVYELWKSGRWKPQEELGKALGKSGRWVWENVEAASIRKKEKIPATISTRTIIDTTALEKEDRAKIIAKVKKEELPAEKVREYARVVKEAPEVVKKELLKKKSSVTPRMVETIVEKLPNEDEQSLILEEINQLRLTEDEVEDRVREIQRAKEMGEPLRKEMGVKEGIIYTVGEYECPHCKRHYLIKCDGKRDWVE